MRQSKFGDSIVESEKDDISEFVADESLIYAIVEWGDKGFFFTVRENESGDEVVCSDDIFSNPIDAKMYLKKFNSKLEIQIEGKG